MSNYELVLAHHGMKGQQWGVRQVPWYPIDAYKKHLKESGYSDKSINKIMGRVNSGASDSSIKRAIKKQTRIKDREEAAKKKATAKRMEDLRKAKAKKEEETRAKNEAINTGDLDYVSKNRDKLTNEEIKAVEDRYRVNKSINDLVKERDTQADRDKTQKMLNNLDTMNSVADKMAKGLETGTRVYNSVAKIANAFGDKNLPIIGDKPVKKSVTIERDDTTGTVKKTVDDGTNKTITTEYTEAGKARKEQERLEEIKKAESKSIKVDTTSGVQTVTTKDRYGNTTETKSLTKEASVAKEERERIEAEKEQQSKFDTYKSKMKSSNSVEAASNRYGQASSILNNQYRTGKISEAEYKAEIQDLIDDFNITRSKIK